MVVAQYCPGVSSLPGGSIPRNVRVVDTSLSNVERHCIFVEVVVLVYCRERRSGCVDLESLQRRTLPPTNLILVWERHGPRAQVRRQKTRLHTTQTRVDRDGQRHMIGLYHSLGVVQPVLLCRTDPRDIQYLRSTNTPTSKHSVEYAQ